MPVCCIRDRVSDAQHLRPLAPEACAARPRKKYSMLCGKYAKSISHTTYYIKRALQVRASDQDGNRTYSETDPVKGADRHGPLTVPGQTYGKGGSLVNSDCWRLKVTTPLVMFVIQTW